ncbi:hypothetical protein N9937_02280 [bacterium]|nr:hypothetical protein [bacterium]
MTDTIQGIMLDLKHWHDTRNIPISMKVVVYGDDAKKAMSDDVGSYFAFCPRNRPSQMCGIPLEFKENRCPCCGSEKKGVPDD